MNETSRRIKAYQDALPGLRERVLGVALLLVMSMAMMTSATFAWLTLSRAPEVSSVATTVTANGNLEIALSDTDGLEPEESAVGDSSTKQAVTLANLTWGNLVNLSDPSYGLDYLQLRPAMLGDTSDLLNSPLVSVNFGQDGRVEDGYNYDLNFTNWNNDDDKKLFEFSPNETKYGVRAISTIQYIISNTTYKTYRTLVQEANSQNAAARNAYRAIMGSNTGAKDTANIKAIAKLMGDYMTYKLNSYEMSELDVTSSVDEIYTMMVDFNNAYALAGNALMKLVNIQIFLNSSLNYETYYYRNSDAMWLYDSTTGNKTGLDWTTLNGLGINITSLKQFEADVLKLQKDLAIISQYYDPEAQEVLGGTVYWTDIDDVIIDLVDIPSCTVAGSASDAGVAIQNLGRSAAMDLLGKDIYAVIKKGLIVNFEKLTGEQIDLQGVEVTAKYIVSLTMEAASIKTAAFGGDTYGKLYDSEDDAVYESTYQYDRDTYCGFDTSNIELSGVAQNTYGMAIDMWVRTNAANSYLVLEGNVLTEEYSTPATLTLSSGEVVNLYSATITYPEEETGDDSTTEDDALGGLVGNTESVDVYYMIATDSAGNEVVDSEGNAIKIWYFADTHGTVYQLKTETVTNEDGTTTTYTVPTTTPTKGESVSISTNQKMNTRYDVTGYEGENRVWQENSLLTVNSTTQGSGSCYVFYADNPADQQSSLKLLSNLRVAFLSSTGDIMAMAKLDKDNAYEASGKVTVPLVLTTSANAIYTPEGDLAIALLGQNEATRMTMIVYLEGTELTNDQVLAADEIQGKLNIQFGSSAALDTMGDSNLENAEMYVSATVDKTAFDFAADDNMTVNVTVTVDGDTPNSVTAAFVRKINNTQGSREETILFEPDGNGTYTGSYTFHSPGVYELRWIQVDGRDFELDTKPTVTVTGLNYDLICSVNDAVLTGNHSYTTSSGALKVKINTNDQDKMPKSVQLQFIDNQTGAPVTALLSYNNSTGYWEGTTTFTASGSYTLTYLIMDGEYTELAEGEKKTINLTLGVSVRVRDDVDDPNFEYESEGYSIGMLVDIVNEAGTVLANLQGARLYYGKQGSALEENGLNTDLKWDAAKQCYTGTFLLKKTGIYRFNYVTVAGNTITSTTNTAPVYTMKDPNPPEFVQNRTVDVYQLNVGNSATMGFSLLNTGSAQVLATVLNTTTGSSKEIDVTTMVKEQKLDDNTYQYLYTFTLPSDLDTTGVDGHWQLTRIRLSGVYDDQQVYYYGAAANEADATEDRYLTWNLTADTSAEGIQVTDSSGSLVTNIVTQVQTPVITVAGYTEYHTGRVFRSSYTNKNAITLTVKDALGNALSEKATLGKAQTKYVIQPETDMGYSTNPNLSVVGNAYQYTYTTDTNGAETETVTTLTAPVSVTYGAGHNNTDLRSGANNEVFTVYDFVSNGDGTYTLAEDSITMNYAGLYICNSLTVTIGGHPFDLSASHVSLMPKYAVQTSLPVVTVSAISPAQGTTKRVYTVKEPSTVDQTVSGDFFRKSDYYAAVYIYTDAKGGTLDQEAAHAYAPSVTLQLSGLSGTDFEGATMTFTTSNTDSLSSTFNFGATLTSGAVTATTTVGKAVDGSEGWFGVDTYPKSYPAGRMTQNKVTLTYDGKGYTFTLANTITIDQPQAPAILQFTAIPTSYTGTHPANELGMGSTVTVTLPRLQWTATLEEAQDGTWSAYTSTGETTEAYQVYTMKESGSWVKTRTYQFYEWTKFVSSITTTVNYYSQGMVVNQWRINGRVYNAGDTVTIDGSGYITAEAITSAYGEKTFLHSEDTTIYRYLYGYVTGETKESTKVFGAWTYTPSSGTLRSTAPSLANASTQANMTTDPDGWLTYSPANS